MSCGFSAPECRQHFGPAGKIGNTSDREHGYRLPNGWDEARLRRVLEHYESQTNAEAAAHDEAYRSRGATLMEIPFDLLAEVRKLIARKRAV